MNQPGQIPDELQSLAEALRAYPDVTSVGPTEGRDGAWAIAFRIKVDEDRRPTTDAWLSLEFIGWYVRDRRRAGYGVRLSIEAIPPHLNEPGYMSTFWLDGWGSATELTALPDWVASGLNEARDAYYMDGRAVAGQDGDDERGVGS